MNTNITRTEMEALATVLANAKKSGSIPPEKLTALHHKFTAEDESGATWTVGLQSLKWHRKQDGGWVASTPPDQLLIDGQLHAELAVLLPAEPEESALPPIDEPPPLPAQPKAAEPAAALPETAPPLPETSILEWLIDAEEAYGNTEKFQEKLGDPIYEETEAGFEVTAAFMLARDLPFWKEERLVEAVSGIFALTSYRLVISAKARGEDEKNPPLIIPCHQIRSAKGNHRFGGTTVTIEAEGGTVEIRFFAEHSWLPIEESWKKLEGAKPWEDLPVEILNRLEADSSDPEVAEKLGAIPPFAAISEFTGLTQKWWDSVTEAGWWEAETYMYGVLKKLHSVGIRPLEGELLLPLKPGINGGSPYHWEMAVVPTNLRLIIDPQKAFTGGSWRSEEPLVIPLNRVREYKIGGFGGKLTIEGDFPSIETPVDKEKSPVTKIIQKALQSRDWEGLSKAAWGELEKSARLPV